MRNLHAGLYGPVSKGDRCSLNKQCASDEVYWPEESIGLSEVQAHGTVTNRIKWDAVRLFYIIFCT